MVTVSGKMLTMMENGNRVMKTSLPRMHQANTRILVVAVVTWSLWV